MYFTLSLWPVFIPRVCDTCSFSLLSLWPVFTPYPSVCSRTVWAVLLFSTQGDLGAIDEKYDVAVSTACGPLDNIVVDSMTTAQRCVELLIKHNVGVATFIGLDKMEKWKEHTKRKITTSVWLWLLRVYFRVLTRAVSVCRYLHCLLSFLFLAPPPPPPPLPPPTHFLDIHSMRSCCSRL